MRGSSHVATCAHVALNNFNIVAGGRCDSRRERGRCAVRVVVRGGRTGRLSCSCTRMEHRLDRVVAADGEVGVQVLVLIAANIERDIAGVSSRVEVGAH
eukprot:3127040-Pleurochrysis_carterae.AAC.1